MTTPYPSTLIFVDFPTDEPEKAADFYRNVFGWEVEPRPAGSFYRIVPGQNFKLPDGSQGPTGNLHLGITNVANRRPHPSEDGLAPRHLSRDSHAVRIWILVSADDDMDAISDRAIANGATELWRHHYYNEFNGFNNAFKDPWGNTLVLWTYGGASGTPRDDKPRSTVHSRALARRTQPTRRTPQQCAEVMNLKVPSHPDFWACSRSA